MLRVFYKHGDKLFTSLLRKLTDSLVYYGSLNVFLCQLFFPFLLLRFQNMKLNVDFQEKVHLAQIFPNRSNVEIFNGDSYLISKFCTSKVQRICT